MYRHVVDLHESLPVRECGLKSGTLASGPRTPLVTPRAGVWIEIFLVNSFPSLATVTPRAGVWIEI